MTSDLCWQHQWRRWFLRSVIFACAGCMGRMSGTVMTSSRRFPTRGWVAGGGFPTKDFASHSNESNQGKKGNVGIPNPNINYFESKSFAAFSTYKMARPDKEVPNKTTTTTQTGKRISRDTGSVCLSVASADRATGQLKLRPCWFQAVHYQQERITSVRNWFLSLVSPFCALRGPRVVVTADIPSTLYVFAWVRSGRYCHPILTKNGKFGRILTELPTIKRHDDLLCRPDSRQSLLCTRSYTDLYT